MPIARFPDPRRSTEEGIVALGGDLEPESLILAYSQGIFPWPMSDLPLAWFCPPERAILKWDDLHIPRSLSKLSRKGIYRFTVDQAFARVIQHCADSPRPGQDGTWIGQEIIQAYNRLYELGYAHSVEVWRGDQLVGGIYGVEVQGVFAGESMFHLESNTSKLVILHLMELLHSKGMDWLDIQVMTPHMEKLGATLISRDAFLKKLAHQQKRGLKIF